MTSSKNSASVSFSDQHSSSIKSRQESFYGDSTSADYMCSSLEAAMTDDSTVVDDSSGSGLSRDGEPLLQEQRTSSLYHDGQIRDEFNALAKTNTVSRFKIMVVIMLVCAAVLVTVLVWYFTREDEEDDFELQYETYAERVLESVRRNMDLKVWTAFTLASTFTSRFSPNAITYIQGTILSPLNGGMVWPNVTVLDFQEQSRGALILAHASTVFFAPLVTNETFQGWLDYANQVHAMFPQPDLGHHSQGIAFSPQSRDDSSSSPAAQQDTHNNNSNGASSPDVSRDSIVFPLWHVAPRRGNEEGFLFNEYSDPVRRDALDSMLLTRLAAFTDVLFRSPDFHKGRNQRHREPTTILFTPIFKDFDSPEIVGIIGIEFVWGQTLAGILPPNVEGICVVLESQPSGLQFTFHLNGNRAEFLGVGDLHNDKFDDMEFRLTYDIPTAANGRDLNHQENSGSRFWRSTSKNDGNYSGSQTNYLRSHGYRQTPHDASNNLDDFNNDTATTYTIRVFPSLYFEEQYISNRPAIFASIVALIFFFTTTTFIFYDCLVETRQAAVLNRAVQSSRIVHQLFPQQVRERLFIRTETEPSVGGRSSVSTRESALRLKKYLRGASSSSRGMSPSSSSDKRDHSNASSVSPKSEPIADMFPSTTILFADIAGFTAWSSERQPSQVFVLLETIYREFDVEAKKYGVFKIETIGDCYVAATGLPEPQDEHAVIMTRFAQRCLTKFVELTRELELSLGPGTASLGLRIGMHSGAVTGGVLRGEKSRFQLFGDTMNTASRMESSGKTHMIQVSPETASLLKDAGKDHWLIPRADIVTAKGKGEIQTFWIRTQVGPRSSLDLSVPGEQRRPPSQSRVGPNEEEGSIEKPVKPPRGSSTTPAASSQHDLDRLIRWNSAVLEDLLLKVMVHRQFYGTSDDQQISDLSSEETPLSNVPNAGSFDSSKTDSKMMAVDEMTDEVSFESYRTRTTDPMKSPERIKSIGEAAAEELTFYVACIASMYRNVHFHNFDHASHVTMSASKLMKKICTEKGAQGPARSKEDEEAQIRLFFKTFGISSDPLAQFAVVFAALVHDVDHFGITNDELIKVKPDFASKFNNISVAEQNSIHVAWELLMEPDFPNLRKCIFGNNEDRHRFKQLLIHMIIATDIADRQRMDKEKKRWNEAFSNMPEWENKWRNKTADQLAKVDVSFKATAVLEQLMLASDVAHTMQHWMVYIKWNEKFFYERIAAFASGMSEIDPRVGWYENELAFFDGYIIPLAKRLKECGVFGTAGDEYLGYALKNRQEWLEKGKFILDSYIRRVDNENLLNRYSERSSRSSSRRRLGNF